MEFRIKWLQEESFLPFDPTHYWRTGLNAVFGEEVTTKATAGVRTLQDFESKILPDYLHCDCEVNAIDFETDTEIKIALALNLAELALVYEFALIDPVLTHDLGTPYGRTNLPLFGQLPNHLKSNSTFMERSELVYLIIWGEDVAQPRGWEWESFEERLDWVYILSQYLEPLWQNHEFLKGKTIYVLMVDQVTPDIVESLDDDDTVALKKIEMALLVFWSTTLQHDFGILHTPFFSSVGVHYDEYRCVAHQ